MLPPLTNKDSDQKFRFPDPNAIRAWAFEMNSVKNLRISSTSTTGVRVRADMAALRSSGGEFAVVDSTQTTIADEINASMANSDAMAISLSEDLSELDDHLISLKDSAGDEILRAYAKAASGTIGYGSEVVSNGGFTTNTSDWVAGNDAVLTSEGGGQDGNCLQIKDDGTSNPSASQNLATDTSALYELGFYVKEGNQSNYKATFGTLLNTGTTVAGSTWEETSDRYNVGSATSVELEFTGVITPGVGSTIGISGGLEADFTTTGAFIGSTSEDLSSMDTYEVTITDGSGNEASAFASVVTGSTTYGSSLLSNGGFTTNTSSWSSGNSASLSSESGGQDGNCLRVTEGGADSPYAQQTVTTVDKALYDISFYEKEGAYGWEWWWTYFWLNNNVVYEDGGGDSAWAQQAWLFAADGTGSGIQIGSYASSGDGTYIQFDTVVIRRMTSPGPTGLELYQDSGLSTRGMASVDAGFDQNDISRIVATVPATGQTILFDSASLKRITSPPATYGLELYSDSARTTRGLVSTGSGDPNDGASIGFAEIAPGIDVTLDLETTGAAGLDGGTLTNGWYAIFAVGNDTNEDGLIDSVTCIASKSFTQPAIPAGYTHKLLIGCFLVQTIDDVVQVTPFFMQDSRFIFKVEVDVIGEEYLSDGEDVPRTELDLSGAIPPFATQAYLRPMIGCGPGTGHYLYLYAKGQTNPKRSIVGGDEDFTPGSAWVPCFGRAVEYLVNNPNILYLYLYCNGFIFKPAGGALR